MCRTKLYDALEALSLSMCFARVWRVSDSLVVDLIVKAGEYAEQRTTSTVLQSIEGPRTSTFVGKRLLTRRSHCSNAETAKLLHGSVTARSSMTTKDRYHEYLKRKNGFRHEISAVPVSSCHTVPEPVVR